MGGETHSIYRFLEIFGTIVTTLEEINELGSKHSMAFSLLQAILSYEFLASLVVCAEISGLMLPVTRYLQKRNIDLSQAKKSVTNLQNALKERRRNVDESFNSLFEQIKEIADEHEVQSKVPRKCNRQSHRANAGQVLEVKQHYKLNLYIPFVDHCIVCLLYTSRCV